MRRLRLLVVVLLAIGLLGPAAPARSQSGTDLVDACLANGGSASMCRGLYQLLRIPGGACRDLASSPECAVFDGISIDEALVAAQEASWLNLALRLQQGLDDDHPLQDELWPHTHNSYNADAYSTQLASGLDRNHIYSIADQLRMGSRAIEIDIHWAPHVTSGGANAVQACHGEAANLELLTYHLGCEYGAPLLDDLLVEFRTWLNNNPGEVVILYLENALDGDVSAHNQAAASVSSRIGDLVYKPASACEHLPMDISRQDIRDRDARVLVTGNPGPGDWCDWVHERGPRWNEGGLDYGDDFPAFPCTQEREAEGYDTKWIRHWGDETGLSAGAGAGGDVTPTDAFNMTRCGVNMIGFDNLVPFDARMEQLVWSWKTSEPSTNASGFCALHNQDGRFSAADCSVTTKVIKKPRKGKKPKKKVVEEFRAEPFICFDGTDWAVTSKADRFSAGQATCEAEGLGDFSVPWTGYENERLKHAKGEVPEAWLNYAASGDGWTS